MLFPFTVHRINASTDSNFKGVFAVDLTTGVVPDEAVAQGDGEHRKGGYSKDEQVPSVHVGKYGLQKPGQGFAWLSSAR